MMKFYWKDLLFAVTRIFVPYYHYVMLYYSLFWGVLIWKRKAEEALIASGLPFTVCGNIAYSAIKFVFEIVHIGGSFDCSKFAYFLRYSDSETWRNGAANGFL